MSRNTKATLIEPVLRALGWDLEDLEVLQREAQGAAPGESGGLRGLPETL